MAREKERGRSGSIVAAALGAARTLSMGISYFKKANSIRMAVAILAAMATKIGIHFPKKRDGMVGGEWSPSLVCETIGDGKTSIEERKIFYVENLNGVDHRAIARTDSSKKAKKKTVLATRSPIVLERPLGPLGDGHEPSIAVAALL